MLVLTRKNRESVVIGRPEDNQVVLQITVWLVSAAAEVPETAAACGNHV